MIIHIGATSLLCHPFISLFPFSFFLFSTVSPPPNVNSNLKEKKSRNQLKREVRHTTKQDMDIIFLAHRHVHRFSIKCFKISIDSPTCPTPTYLFRLLSSAMIPLSSWPMTSMSSKCASCIKRIRTVSLSPLTVQLRKRLPTLYQQHSCLHRQAWQLRVWHHLGGGKGRPLHQQTRPLNHRAQTHPSKAYTCLLRIIHEAFDVDSLLTDITTSKTLEDYDDNEDIFQP